MRLISALVPLVVFVFGCATVSITIPEDAVALTTDEITETFSGVKESYRGKDNPAITVNGVFGEAGEFEASWFAGNQNGKVTGEWYAEDGKRCLRITSVNGGGADLECHAIYKTGDVYTSVNEDGTVNGTHTLSPLN